MTQLIVCASEISHSRAGATEFTKTRKIPRDSVEILSNTCLYNISQLLGLFTCHKLANLSWNFVTEMCKQRRETIKHRLCCEKLGTSQLLKALPLVHFWSVLLLKEQMMSSSRKMLKTLFSLSAKFALKIPAKSADFSANLPLKIPWKLIWLFFRDISEALHSMARSIRFANMDRSRYKFGGKLTLFMRFGTFFMMKASQSLWPINRRDTTHFDSENVYHAGCWNISHCQQQSYSGLCSPGQSCFTYLWNDSWVQTFHIFRGLFAHRQLEKDEVWI